MKRRLTSMLLVIIMVLMLMPLNVFASEIQVDEVKFEKTKAGKYRVSWSLSNGENNMSVDVYLVTGEKDTDGILLGTIRSGATGSLTVALPEIDPGYYHFMIGVSSMNGDDVYGTSKEALLYEDKDRKPAPTEVVVGRGDGKIFVSYKEDGPSMVYIYDADTKELLSETKCTVKPAEADIPKGAKNILVATALLSKGKAGNIKTVTLSPKDKAAIEDPFPEEEITNQADYALVAENIEGESYVYINGEKCDSTDIELKEGENVITVFQVIKNQKAMASQKVVILDTVAPILTLEGAGTTINTTKKKVFIQGYAEEGAFVTCDNEAVALVGRCFSVEKSLMYGTSKIRLAAVDEAGNTSVYQIEVTRSPWSVDNKLLIVVGALAFIGIVGEVFMLAKGRRKRRKEDENS